MKLINRFWIIFIISFISRIAFSQCGTCNLEVQNNQTSTYNVGPNYTLCIKAGLTYTGTINLNGGTLCNSGTVTKVNFNSGTFNNYGLFNKAGNLSVQNTGNIIINNYSGSSFSCSGNLEIQSSSTVTEFIINLQKGKTSFNIDGSLSCLKGTLEVNPKTDTKLFSEGVFVNIGGEFYVGGNGALLMNIGQGTYFNVNKVASFDGKYNKTINNLGGVINVNNSFNIGGNGNNQGVFTLLNTNKGTISIKKHFNASYNNGTVNITNYSNFSVEKSWTQSKDVTNVINYGTLSITEDLTIERGSFTNNGKLSARDGDVKFGIFTNNYYSEFNRDLITSNGAATINNNGYIFVKRDFSNKATVNFSLKSTFETTNYDNTNNGTINGPTNPPDTTSYARIFISGSSENKGYLNGKMLFHDQSLVYNSGNAGFGFDVVGNANRIGSGVLFAAKTPIVIGPPIFNCLFTNFLYFLDGSASPNSVCPGSGTINLKAQFYKRILFGPGGFLTFSPQILPPNSYTWTPSASFSNPLLQNQTIPAPTATTTYTVKVKQGLCIFTKTITVTVNAPAVVTISSNQTPVCLNASLILSTPIIPGVTIYQWHKGTVPVAGATAPAFTPLSAGSYYLKVSTSAGCSSNSNTITVVPSPAVNITPTATTICSGGTSLLTANNTIIGAGAITNYQWQQNGSNVGTNISTYLANSAGSYVVSVTAANGCSATSSPAVVNVSTVLASAGSSSIITTAGPITLNGSASGGVPTYNYNWTPTSAFSPASNATLQNPVVNVSANLTFNLTVTDNAGCSSSDYVSILFLNGINSYGHLKKNQDGAYYQAIGNKVYFKFDEEYKGGVAMSYNIYNYTTAGGTSAPVQTITCSGLNITTVHGDNRYYIDLTCASFIANNFYLLEVINSKKEKFYLKFKA